MERSKATHRTRINNLRGGGQVTQQYKQPKKRKGITSTQKKKIGLYMEENMLVNHKSQVIVLSTFTLSYARLH
jgi:hypothetical protein